MSRTKRGSAAATVVGALAVAGVLAFVLAGRRHEFADALRSAPVWVLVVAAALQVVALVMRCEAWHTCVGAAGATISRRRLFRAGGLGNLGSVLNAQLGTAARIGALRRWAPEETPRIPALIAAEVPILTVEATLAVIASFTLVGPLGLPWWSPVIGFAAMLGVLAALRRLAGREHGFCRGLAVLRSLDGRNRVVALVLVAVFAQIARNWLVLRALGVDASLLDATAVLIAMVVLAQLPIGPSVGAAAVVVILGAGGVALTAAAGVLLTVTGTAGGLLFATWAGVDLLGRFRGGGRARLDLTAQGRAEGPAEPSSAGVPQLLPS
jgi:uncharacterized membrane protein YbhN (UPF0104 family)